MTTTATNINGGSIAVVNSPTVEISTVQQALDLLVEYYYQNADGIVLFEHNLSPDFFDLKTGLAGDILQKFSTYRMRLAIIGDFTKYASKSLQDFIRESNKLGHIIFADSIEQAKELLNKSQS